MKAFYTAPQAEQIEIDTESCIATSEYSVGGNSIEKGVVSDVENWFE